MPVDSETTVIPTNSLCFASPAFVTTTLDSPPSGNALAVRVWSKVPQGQAALSGGTGVSAAEERPAA